jgi:hypothetical protein
MTSKNSETKTKFNPKVFSGKARMYRPVLGAPRISKLYIWNTDRKEYLVPETGKPYMARRYEVSLKGGSSRTTQFFSTLDEARKWQMASSDSEKATATSATLEKSGPKLSDVVLTWKKGLFHRLLTERSFNTKNSCGFISGTFLICTCRRLLRSEWIFGLMSCARKRFCIRIE